MGNLNRFDDLMDNNRPAGCCVCEAMLPDAVDGTLSESEQKAFDKHVAGCADCAQELGEAQRGAAWLQMLKGHTPEPSASLLTKILAQTTGSENSPAIQTAASPVPRRQQVLAMPAMLPQTADVSHAPAKTGGRLLAFRQKVTQIFAVENARLTFQPRLAMTAAMAFFSIALTLNMTGVKLGNLRVADLQPSTLRRTVIDTTSSAARSFHNMRVVYQVESKLEDLQADGLEERIPLVSPAMQQTTPAPAPAPKHDDSDRQEKPKGHSALKFLTIGAEETVEKGA